MNEDHEVYSLSPPLPSPSLPFSLSPSLPLSLSPSLISPFCLLHLSSFLPLSLPQAFSHEVTAKKPEYDPILADSQNLLQLKGCLCPTNEAAEPRAEMVEALVSHWLAITKVATVVKWFMYVILETIFG